MWGGQNANLIIAVRLQFSSLKLFASFFLEQSNPEIRGDDV